MTLSDINTILNATEEIHRLRAELAEHERRAQAATCWCESCGIASNGLMRLRMSICPECGDKRCPRAAHHDNACATPVMSDEKAKAIAKIAHDTIRAQAEQPRTDAEWKAADRKKRINDLAARYAGHGMDCVLRYSTAHEMAKIAAAARALAAAVVEAEE